MKYPTFSRMEYRKRLRQTKPPPKPMTTDIIKVSRMQIEFGICIRNYRRLYSLSQQEFAEIVSVFLHRSISSATISQYENFNQRPSELTMNAILTAMHLTVNDIKH